MCSSVENWFKIKTILDRNFDGFKDFLKIQSDQSITNEQKNLKNLPNIELKTTSLIILYSE